MDKTQEIMQSLLHVQTKADGQAFAEALKAELLEGWGSEVEIYGEGLGSIITNVN